MSHTSLNRLERGTQIPVAAACRGRRLADGIVLSGSPKGAVSLSDVSVALAQVGDACWSEAPSDGRFLAIGSLRTQCSHRVR